jgi:hypothetical protein
MNAFVDANGVLTSWGYMESNGDDTLIVVDDGFNYQTGTVRFDGSAWVPYIAPADPAVARTERDRLLRSVYDPGIAMALRALRMASSPTATAYAEGKISELDAYAEALVAIPDQPGFPDTITWPVPPTK